MDLSSLNQFGPWGVLIAAAAYFLYQRFGPKQPTPSPIPTPAPQPVTPSAPDPQSNPLAYLIWMLLQQWLQPAKEPDKPVTPSSPAFQVAPDRSPVDDASEAALANLIRSDADRCNRIVKLLSK